jgi:chromosome segregation ATPase
MAEVDQGMQQMLEHLLAGQEEAAASLKEFKEEMKAGQEEIKAHKNKADTEAKAQLKDIKGHMVALLEGLTSCLKRMTACQALPNKLKAGPEEMETASVHAKWRPWIWRQIQKQRKP